MLRYLIIMALGLLPAYPAMAQQPVVPGSQTTNQFGTNSFIPYSATNPLPVISSSSSPTTVNAQGAVTTANPAYTPGTNQPISLTPAGGTRSAGEDINGIQPDFTATMPTQQIGPYPSTNVAGTLTSAVPVSASSGNVANSAAAATLAAASGKTTYIAGLLMTSGGATGTLSVNCTIVGLLSGTVTFTYTFEALTIPSGPLSIQFNPPLPGSATNTAIVASCPAGGSGAANAAMNVWGFQL